MKSKKKMIAAGGVTLALVTVVLFMWSRSVDGDTETGGGRVVTTLSVSYNDDYMLYVERNLMWICDRESGGALPLCDKPECTHEGLSNANPSPDCNAAVEDGLPENPFIYDERLYYFAYGTEEYGTGTYILYEADTNGGNRRRLGIYEDVDFVTAIEISEGYLFIAGRTQYDAEDVNVDREEPIAFLLMIDLNNGESMVVEERSGYDATIGNLCYSNGVLSYLWSYMDIKIDYLELDPADVDVYWYLQEHRQTEVYRYDTEKQERQLLHADNGMQSVFFYDKGCYIVRSLEEGCYLFRLAYESGEEQELMSAYSIGVYPDEAEVLCAVWDEEMGAAYYRSDPEKGNLDWIVELSETEGISITAILDDVIYVIAESEGEFLYGYLEKEQFYNGEFEVYPIRSANFE